jgi:hypothetical protein
MKLRKLPFQMTEVIVEKWQFFYRVVKTSLSTITTILAKFSVWTIFSVDKKAGQFHKAVTGSAEKWKKTEIIRV